MRVYLKIAILTTWGSQTRFARAIGKRDDWVSQIVTGRKNPTIEEKALIARHLAEKHSKNPGLLFVQEDSLKQAQSPVVINGD